MCALWNYFVHLLRHSQKYRMSMHNFHFCLHAKMDPKLWVPTDLHLYYLARPRASYFIINMEKSKEDQIIIT